MGERRRDPDEGGNGVKDKIRKGGGGESVGTGRGRGEAKPP